MTKPGPDPISKDTCRDALHFAAQRLGHSPSIREYRSLDISPNASTIKRHFGGWNAAKEDIDLDTNIDIYEINDTYFDCINTERKAYWLGLFWADGHLDTSGRFNLTSIDDTHLEQLLEDMDAEHPVYRYEDDVPKISIRNEQLVESILELGASTSKSDSGSLPALDVWAWPHFTRGLFDGDGHAKNNPNTSLVITQNKARLQNLQQHVPVAGTIYEGNQTHRIGWWGSDLERMVTWMYPDKIATEPALARKRDSLIKWVCYSP